MSDDVQKAERKRRLAAAMADDEVRAAWPDADVSAALARPGLRFAELVDTVVTAYADRPAVAQRAGEIVVDAEGRRVRRLLPRFETLSYRQLWSRAGALARAWQASGVRAGDFVCTVGFVSSDYVIVDLAGVRLGTVAVPLQATAAVAQWVSIIAETEARVLACSAELLDAAVEAALASATIGQLVVFDSADDDDERAAVAAARSRLAESGRDITIDSLRDLLERGLALPAVPLASAPGDDPLALLVYTSGSTGTPKGAMYTDRLAAAMWLYTAKAPVPAITLNYLPLSHVAGRLQLGGTLARGGTAYFTARSDMSTLFEDLELTRPTELVFVPRVCEMLLQHHQGEVEARIAAGGERGVVEDEVKTELRDRLLGGRFLGAMCASAPLAPEMRAFMESVLGIGLHDGYGSTEAGGSVIVDNKVRRPPVLDYKLVDVPELGYFGTDQPHPRGELLLKTTTMFPGYFKRPEITAEMFDADGFYRTGDVVAELGPDHLVYVDRRNNVLKLSQGEFVTVAKLESVFSTSALIRQIFVYGSSERAYLLAVIVPTEEALTLPEPRAALAESLQELAKEAGLNSYEIPRDFLLETEPFTQDNGLLSGIGKLLRPKLKQRYGERLEQLYAELSREQADELAALRRGAADRPVLETVGRAARALLGCASTDIRPEAHFTDLGGDSLSALSLSNLLTELFGVEVPVGTIVHPAKTLRRLAEYIDGERNQSGRRPTLATVHGPGTRVRAADLTLDAFIDHETLTAAKSLPSASAPPRTVLLTGANGYLGRFLCLEWLDRLDACDGTLICVIRGRDAETARARLDEAFGSGDPVLLQRYRELAQRRLTVLPGDIAEPYFGLDEDRWRELAETVDLVVHPAALVNHVLPYDQLFGPNVVGTAEVVRLAVTARRKPVAYLSTVAVASQVDHFTEDGDIREISPERVIDTGYANGYGNSKWAGEVLLREAHDLCGLPVAVFRSDMILAHSEYAGQFNLPDMFTRLLLSVLATGLAPESFYRPAADGGRARGHYDGLPADFTAAAITALGPGADSGFETFDVLNPHDDGIGLDTFVDWLVDDGHRITRIADYADWLARFETALRALPERQRRHSVLPLLHAFRRPAPAIAGSALPAERFRAAVRAAGTGPDGDIPHLSRELIGKYVRDLTAAGLL
ncbi:Carboxylic acid reductase [Nocardia cerradoensis]|uniref:Carboxylic acid reductase n=1 Tax=Nocardia cerradoensis TaxID=85688 RepID=A0A231H7W5_9NOCA|nr:carboxylic acid reductase [Nocardia cerradoensis]OXR44949.1 Carboxylic acid reductase [Nocardia cerradoensis]